MAQYVISKTHIDQLTLEQKEVLRDSWEPEKKQTVILEKSGRVYTIQKFLGNKIFVGSFKVSKTKVLPELSESDLIHALAKLFSESDDIFSIADLSTADSKYWAVEISKLDGRSEVFKGSELIDALWEAYKVMILD